MPRYCADCAKLDCKKEKKAKVSGSKFLCKAQTKAKKKDVYVNPTDPACDKWEYPWGRGAYERQQIYNKGKYWNDNDTPIYKYLIALAALIIIGLILDLFE